MPLTAFYVRVNPARSRCRKDLRWTLWRKGAVILNLMKGVWDLVLLLPLYLGEELIRR